MSCFVESSIDLFSSDPAAALKFFATTVAIGQESAQANGADADTMRPMPVSVAIPLLARILPGAFAGAARYMRVTNDAGHRALTGPALQVKL